jgi:hypothetical protein
LPNHWLPGIGPRTATQLNLAGLAQIRHIADTPLDMLEILLGSQARMIRQFANGIDERPLLPAREPQKSVPLPRALRESGPAFARLRRGQRGGRSAGWGRWEEWAMGTCDRDRNQTKRPDFRPAFSHTSTKLKHRF